MVLTHWTALMPLPSWRRHLAMVAAASAVGLLAAMPSLAATIYVDGALGNDGNSGGTPSEALRTVGAAATRAVTGDDIVVMPGTYPEGNITPAAFARVTIAAARAGGDVVIDATGYQTGFNLNGTLSATIDGFVVYGAAVGVYVKSGSHQTRIVNNIVSTSSSNGVYVQDSDGVLVFNNIVYNNGGSGILVTGSGVGSRDVKVVNNTVYANGNRGIFFAGSAIASSGGRTLNNIVDGNTIAEIQVNEISLPGHLKAGNVVLGRVPNGTPVDGTDVQGSALFADPAGPDGILGGSGYADDDFRLVQTAAGGADQSPAVDAGAGLAVEFGLAESSTRRDGLVDEGVVDAGFHYGNVGTGKIPAVDQLRFQAIYVDRSSGSDSNSGASAGDALRTIGRAVNRARGGHEVVLAPGTYAEGDLTIANLGIGSRPVRVAGQPGSRIDARGFDRAFLVERSSGLDLRGLEITGAHVAAVQVRHGSAFAATDVLLRENCGHGLWILQESTARLANVQVVRNGRIGITSTDSSVYLENSVIQSNRREGVRLRGGAVFEAADTWVVQNERDGLSSIGVDRFTWRGGRAEGNRVNGLQVADSELAEIEDAYLRRNCNNGLMVLGGGVATVSRARACDNGSVGIVGDEAALVLNVGILENNFQDGVRVKGGSLDAVDILALSNGTKGVSVSAAERMIWLGGRVAGTRGNGIQASETDAVSITDARIHSNRGDGITIYDGGMAVLTNNLVYGNDSTGILLTDVLHGTSDAEITNNTIYDNANRGLMLGDAELVTNSNAVVLRNIFAGNGTAGINVTSRSMPGYAGNFNFNPDRYGPFTPVGLNDIFDVGDPLFVDPSGPDGVLGGEGWADDAFHLQQTAAGQDSQSAAVDAGGVPSAVAGMAQMTTRSDLVGDQGMVDLGFHYPTAAEAPALSCVGDAGEAVEPVDCTGDFGQGNDAGDCDGNGLVSINELVTSVSIGLGGLPLSVCWSADANGDGRVSVADLISAVLNALRPVEQNCQFS
jgi:parallel beta-helix repeat protein